MLSDQRDKVTASQTSTPTNRAPKIAIALCNQLLSVWQDPLWMTVAHQNHNRYYGHRSFLAGNGRLAHSG